ncbi:PDR/VanB family oxidoreductase [Aquabacterium sp. OR-4]|uniref:PDR/VanB family oxidoreductase n=1 Tax=Aquabacterium sp. OR-4 TaxID=2978127 RepID=UPI0021B187EA|nr:PDR/VanB family oxidoreductase [Aquabacterium sp. OR-4]MDT7836153.1 PDR/VanB family oxidoreductase [Aquabacterium sp. OR-4]
MNPPGHRPGDDRQAPPGAPSAGTLQLRIARRWAEAEGICGLELVAADACALPAFTAGAHIDLHLPGGLMRPYSLCSDPADTSRWQLAVLREPASRGGSAAVHELLAEGQPITVGLPRNLFALQPGARHSLLLAGGIGITPLLAMAEHLHRQGGSFTLHVAARSRARLAFAARLAAAPYAAQVRLHLDDGAAAQRLDLPALLAAPQPGVQVYLCGPRGFIDAALAAARAAGWPEAQLHLERFGPAAPAPDAAAALAADGSFSLRLTRSGRVVPVAAGQTAVQALAAAGVSVMTSCEQGVCGTCLTPVVAGVPEHRDQYLTPEEQAANDQFLPCCSRALSAELTLDL